MTAPNTELSSSPALAWEALRLWERDPAMRRPRPVNQPDGRVEIITLLGTVNEGPESRCRVMFFGGIEWSF